MAGEEAEAPVQETKEPAEGEAANEDSKTSPGGRKKIMWGQVFLGQVVDWKGKYGWILPAEMIRHAKASMRQGRIFVSRTDLVGGIKDLLPGVMVQFQLYEDDAGLGAQSCSIWDPRLPWKGFGKGKKGKGKGKEKGKGKDEKEGEEGEKPDGAAPKAAKASTGPKGQKGDAGKGKMPQGQAKGKDGKDNKGKGKGKDGRKDGKGKDGKGKDGKGKGKGGRGDGSQSLPGYVNLGADPSGKGGKADPGMRQGRSPVPGTMPGAPTNIPAEMQRGMQPSMPQALPGMGGFGAPMPGFMEGNQLNMQNLQGMGLQNLNSLQGLQQLQMGLQNPAFAAYVQQGQQGKGMGAPNPAALTMPNFADLPANLRNPAGQPFRGLAGQSFMS